jgi:DNA repair exonuclease SbcCD ATPase subunit
MVMADADEENTTAEEDTENPELTEGAPDNAEGAEAAEEAEAEPSLEDDIQAVSDVLDGLTDILTPEEEADYDANRMPDPGDLERFSQVLSKAKNISGRLEQLLPNVVVTAEATNSAADVSRRASSALENGLDLLQKRVDLVASASADTVKLSKRILFGAIGGLVIGLGLLGGVTFLIVSQGSQIDTMMTQVTERIQKMNSALDTFTTLQASIDELAVTQAAFTEQQVLLGEAVAKAETSANSLREQVPEAAAKTVSVETEKVAAQVKGLSGDLRKQAKQIANLGSKLESFKSQIDEVQTLNTGVQALITLEKQNYRGLLERKMALEEKTGVVAPGDPNLVYYSIHSSK